jgi:hypothetical protein
MARQVSSIGLQVEQKETNYRRVSSTGIMVEQKETNYRRVSSTGIMVEQRTSLYRRIESQGVMLEWDIPQIRQIEGLGVQLEWDIPQIRRIESFGVMVEYEPRIFALITSSSTVTANLINASPVYKMSLGDFRALGTLNGNVYIQGLNSTEAIINGTLFGMLKLTGSIENQILNVSYLWGLNKLKTLSFGLLNTNNQLDGFLHLHGYTADSVAIPPDDLLGFGHLHGLTEGETYFTLRVNGIAPIPNRLFATVQTKGLTLTFNQNTVSITVQNTLFTFNGKQLVYPV